VRHQVVADLNYNTKTVDVQQRVHYTNQTRQVLHQIVLNVEANRWSNVFTLREVRTDAGPLAHQLDARRLTIALDEPLNPGCGLSLVLDFTIELPRVGDEIYSAKGYFGYTERQMNLGHWLPSVAVLQGDTWITRQAVLIGEQEVLNTADWSVTLNLVGEQQAATIAAPGEVQQTGPASWRYTLRNARDFSLSVSDRFIVSSAEGDDGTMVVLYTFEDAQANGAAAHALETAAQSLETFNQLYGAYPDERLLVVQGDFPDGMEFSGMVFVGSSWFTRWPGGPQSYLTLITVHEVAHQWWYAQVGSDPAMTPWLDEALATYSEYVFIEAHYPHLTDWWWAFRVDHYAPRGFVDSTVYEFGSAREYINAVYLRGVRMLHALRDDLGTQAFFDLLADYADAGAGQVATPALFWSLLSEEQREQTAATRALYFRTPQLEPTPTPAP
jgi:hypothetical protein